MSGSNSETKTKDSALPPIPEKRYFTIGEVGELCDIKPHVLRYWEQEFSQLQPHKRRGNRRYYQYQDVLLVRQIRDLLYTQGFTINGARQSLENHLPKSGLKRPFQQHLRHIINELQTISDSLHS